MGIVLHVDGNLGKFFWVETIWTKRSEVTPARFGALVGEDGNNS